MENDQIFLREVNESCGDENFVLVSMRANFEKVRLCETYGDYGQQVGCYNAGCYAINNSESTIHSDLLIDIDKQFNTKFGDILNALGNPNFSSIEELIEELKDINDYQESVLISHNYSPIDENQLNEFATKWVAENENHSSCVAYTYWDGNNFATAIIENEYFDDQVSHVAIDEEEAKLVEEAIENRSFVKEGFGKKIYEYGDYIVIDNYCQGHWESWQVIKKENYEQQL